MIRTLAAQILQMHTDEEITEIGQIVTCSLSGVLANDITGPLAIKSFREMGAVKVFDRDKIFLVMDHYAPAKDIASANQIIISRNFAREMGITHFYEGGRAGIEHALLPELGLVKPCDIVIGADSHTCTYGGLSAFATGLGSTDIACGMALGKLWFKVPSSIFVNLIGKKGKWIRGKDIILELIHTIGVDGARYKALEFGGDGVSEIDVEGRLCIANMAIEAGGKCGLFPSDDLTRQYCINHGTPDPISTQITKSPDYERTVTIDLTSMRPVVACPHLPENVVPAAELKDVKIDQVVIGSCTNGRISDMRDAAAILKGNKINKNIRCIIIPATPAVWKQCMEEGLSEIFIDAGCVVAAPTCGPCLGGYMGVLGDGERCISTTNRNFRGRMGSLQSEVYLASPVVAAASALTGVITSPDSIMPK